MNHTRDYRNSETFLVLLALGVLLLIVLAVAALISFKDPLVDAVVKRIPFSWEKKMGEAIVAKIKLTQKFVTDEGILRDLKVLTQPLTAAMQTDGDLFEFYIAKDGEVNAYALPGGHIVINTALIEAAQTPEEILGVVAHEMAHVTERHVLHQAVSSIGVFLLAQAFLGDVTGFVAVIVDNSNFLLTQKFSRDHEGEADHVGWGFLLAANINPKGMIDFFETLQKEQDIFGLGEKMGEIEKVFSFVSTHPATAERITNLRKKYAALPTAKSYYKYSLDIQKFKDKLKGL